MQPSDRLYRAYAEYDLATDALLVHLARRISDGSEVASGIDDRGFIVYERSDPDLRPASWLRLDNGEAHALYEALGVALGRAHVHQDQGRSDLLHERGRVDKLMDAVVRIAES